LYAFGARTRILHLPASVTAAFAGAGGFLDISIAALARHII